MYHSSDTKLIYVYDRLGIAPSGLASLAKTNFALINVLGTAFNPNNKHNETEIAQQKFGEIDALVNSVSVSSIIIII